MSKVIVKLDMQQYSLLMALMDEARVPLKYGKLGESLADALALNDGSAPDAEPELNTMDLGEYHSTVKLENEAAQMFMGGS